MDPLYPLTFHPIPKERLWGGRKLQSLFGKNLPPGVPVGESWEISDRPDDVSVIANGPLAGKDLRWLMETRSQELIGRASPLHDRFPLLIKILDATQTLSLQVHPPAQVARRLSGEPKTEFWYIADAIPDAQLFVGLRNGCSREDFVQKISAGTVAECFHRVRVKAGDAMFLPSGRVHALGGGLVIFEIQQNSDTTYRVFDWNRLGPDGQPRELHIEKSLASIDFEDFEPDLVRPEARPGPGRVFSLVRDALFSVDLANLKPGENLPMPAGKMRIVGTVSGEVQVRSAQGNLALAAGRFCIIPACVRSATLYAAGETSCLCVGVDGAGV